MTPLQNAAFKGNKDVCELLISHGADVNTNEHENGYTTLMFAALSGTVFIIVYYIIFNFLYDTLTDWLECLHRIWQLSQTLIHYSFEGSNMEEVIFCFFELTVMECMHFQTKSIWINVLEICSEVK